MPTKQLVAEAWIKYSRLTLEPKISDIEHNKIKRAFYAGTSSLYLEVLKLLDSDKEPTLEDLENMKNVHFELVKFSQELEKKRK